MDVETKIEYLPERRVSSLVPHLLKVSVRYLRAARKEWVIAGRNERLLEKLRTQAAPIKLEMGSGPRQGRNGWTTVDIRWGADLQFDLLRSLPFRDGEVDEIYSSHALEYFGFRDIMRMLRDWHRILRPGGQLRLALPNARIFIEAYSGGEPFDTDHYCRYRPALNSRLRIDYVNYMAYMDAHRHMFDEENVITMLRDAGFNQADLRPFDAAIDMPEREFESLYAIAIK